MIDPFKQRQLRIEHLLQHIEKIRHLPRTFHGDHDGMDRIAVRHQDFPFQRGTERMSEYYYVVVEPNTKVIVRIENPYEDLRGISHLDSFPPGVIPLEELLKQGLLTFEH